MFEKTITVGLGVLAVSSIAWLVYHTHTQEEHVLITGGSVGEEYYGLEEKKPDEAIKKFDLLDPECAPEDMLNKIMYGYHIMLDTKKNAAEFSGNALNCNNCHFSGGNTLGGKNRGISLVGVSAAYPRYSKRDKKEISLVDRLENCFKRSMNGKAPPRDSLQMESLVAYLHWISSEVEDASMLPWLGLGPVPSAHTPDAANGKIIYKNNCMICHKENGEGSEEVPPLWGDQSFNDGAGMNTLPMLSSFVWQNMPYGEATLTPEEALDVAAYIISQPRPHFK